MIENEIKAFVEELMAPFINQTKLAIMEITKNMVTQDQLDAAIAALPGQIETAVTTALQPVIAAIQAATTGTPVDLTNELNSLQAMPAAIAAGVASAVAPPAPTPPAGS